MRHLRLTHQALDFWIDVRLREFEGRWLAVADLAGEPDVGLDDEPRDALWRALGSFPIVRRSELIAEAERQLARA